MTEISILEVAIILPQKTITERKRRLNGLLGRIVERIRSEPLAEAHRSL